jgi:hypothetical protein
MRLMTDPDQMGTMAGRFTRASDSNWTTKLWLSLSLIAFVSG